MASRPRTLNLLLIWPVLLILAIGVKLSSPGPIIFKQRRYGLDGQEILVYKFRSMKVVRFVYVYINNLYQKQFVDKFYT